MASPNRRALVATTPTNNKGMDVAKHSLDAVPWELPRVGGGGGDGGL